MAHGATYGDEAIKLIRELKRSCSHRSIDAQSPNTVILPYREDTVRDVVAEIRFLGEESARLNKQAHLLMEMVQEQSDIHKGPYGLFVAAKMQYVV